MNEEGNIIIDKEVHIPIEDSMFKSLTGKLPSCDAYSLGYLRNKKVSCLEAITSQNPNYSINPCYIEHFVYMKVGKTGKNNV